MTQIVDQYGNPMRTAKPVQGEIAVRGVYDKFSSYPTSGLTPQRLAQILREADEGNVLRQMEMFEEMEEKDGHLFSQLQTRKNAVLGIDYDVIAFSDDERDKEIAQFVEDELKNMEDLDDAFLDLLDAIGKGFAIAEIIWEIRGGRVRVKDIKRREQKKFFWDEDDTLKVITDEHPQGIALPERKFIMHKYKAKSGHPSRAGVLRVCAWMYLFKNYDVKDWVAFTEVYGMPIRLGKYNAGASEDQKDALMQALVSIGSDAAGIIPEGAAIEIIEAAKASSINVFEALANYCNREMSKAVLGQTLTSELGSSGSFAASKTHDGVRQDLLEADCKALAKTMKKDLIQPLVLFNFGVTDRLPTIKFHCEPPEDLMETAEVYSRLIEDGLEISQDHVYEKFGVPKPEAGEKLMKKAAAMPLPLKDEAVHQIANKDAKVHPSQKAVDELTDEAVKQSGLIFDEMFDPIRKLTLQANSLEEIEAALNDPAVIKTLFDEMNSDDLEDLILKTMFLSELQGRTRA